MKKLNLFIVLLPLLGACKFATEPPLPIIPPDSIVITSVTIEVTATTATIKTTVTTSKTTTVTVEYGVSSYANTVNATPSPINGSMSVSAKISNLTPNTTYKFRFKTVVGYSGDSTFVTKNEFQIGDSYKNGTVIRKKTSNVPGLVAALFDQSDSTRGLTLAEAIEACKRYGEGYRLPDSTELKVMLNAKNLGIIKNFVGPKFSPAGPYLSCTVSPGNLDWVFFLGFNGGQKGWVSVNNYLYARAVCSF